MTFAPEQISLGMGGHQSSASKTDEWLTPPWILTALGSFDLDPCAPVIRPWKMAERHFTVLDNGLKKPWGGARVFLNPPYGPPHVVAPWMRRMAEHNNGVALIFARTETDMFFETVWSKASLLLFIRGRLHFHYVDGRRASANAGAPSVLIAYGESNVTPLRNCGVPGQFVQPEQVLLRAVNTSLSNTGSK